MDAVERISDLRGRLLRSLADAAFRHFEGIQQAARHAKMLTCEQCRRLVQLDEA